MNCPQCASPETLFKNKLSKWLCTDCGTTFEPPSAAEPHAASLAANPKRIFFSYGHDLNKPLIDRFKADLEKRGHAVWIDYKQLGTWDDWKGGITRGIHDSQLAVAFLSIHSTRDPGVCRNEVAMALHHFGTVYPVLVEKVPAESIPATIQHLQWPDLSDWQRRQQEDSAEFERFYEERLMEIINKVEGEATRFASEAEVMRRVLSPSSFDGKFYQHLDGFVGREWLFDEFEQWLNHKPDSRVFWLKAGPGFGKTAFAVQLANRYRAAVVGTWFCEQGSAELTDPLCAVRTLAFQLALRWDDYRTRLLPRLGLGAASSEVQIREALESLARKNLPDTFSHLISEPLAGLIWREHKLVILLDALDEATDAEGQNTLSALINGRFLELPPWISFVATSRPDAPVVGHLQRFKPFEIAAEDRRNTADLRLYCRQVLGTVPGIPALGEAEREQLYESVVGKSSGMVLYLRMVVEGLLEGSLALGDLNRMEVGLGGLRSRYYTAFGHRFGSDYADSVQPLLRLVMAAPGPLPLALAGEVLGCGKEAVRGMRTRLGAYLTESAGGLSIFHKTLEEWLRCEASGAFFTDSDSARTDLGKFLWGIFAEREDDGRGLIKTLDWEASVMDWVPRLLPTMPQWERPEKLADFANFLSVRARYQGAETLYRRALAGHEKALGPDHPDTLETTNKLGILLHDTGDLDGAEALHRRAFAGREKTLGPSHPDTLASANNLGMLLKDKGNMDGAEPLYRRALAGLEKALGPDHPHTLASTNNLGNLLNDKGDLDGAEALHRRVLASREKALGPDHPDTLDSVHNLGNLLNDRGDLDGSEALHRRALAGFEKALGPEHPATLDSVNCLGALLRKKRDLNGAEPLYRRALAGFEKALGAEHPSTLGSLNNLGNLLKDKGDLDGAESLYRLALEGRKKILGPDHPDTLASISNLGSLLKDQEDLEGAETLYRYALAGREKALGPSHPDTLSIVNSLGILLKNRGDINGAEAFYRRALRGLEKALGPNHPNTLQSVNNLGNLLKNKGDFDGAESLHRRALAGREKALGPDHPDTLTSFNNLANVLKNKGDVDGAEFLHRRALAAREKALGPDHPDTLQSVHNLGNLLDATSRRKEAIDLLRKWTTISEIAADEVRYNLACYECLAGNEGEAKRLITKHLALHPGMKSEALQDPDFQTIHQFLETL